MGSVRQTLSGSLCGILALSFSLASIAGADAAPAPVRRPAGNQQVVKKGCDLTPAYNAYLGKLQNRVLSKWNTLLADGRNNVTLAATINTDGSVQNVTMHSTPSNPTAEQAALDAFNGSQPLDALPSGSSPVVITFVFTSTSDPHGDSNSSMSAKMAPVTAPSANLPPSSSPSSSSSSYTPPADTPPASSAPASSATGSGATYPAQSGMPADLGLGSVLPPEKDGGQSAPAAQSVPASTPAAAPATAPADAAPASAAPAEAAPAAQAAPASATPAAVEPAPAATGKEGATQPESAPASTPVGGTPASTGGDVDNFTPSETTTQPPQGSQPATYGTPESP